MGSPLYAEILERAAEDAAKGGPTWCVLSPFVASGRGGALALRLMAAVHRLVLTGRAARLGPHYPSAGGSRGLEGAWQEFRRVETERRDALRELVALPCQTNEVGRSAALVFGFFEALGRTSLPVRLLEVGASAGLNLRWDRFLFGGGGSTWGDPASPVDLRGHWVDAPSPLPDAIRVVERRGCDLHPVDPTTAEGRLALVASVWADQTARLARLRGALQLAAEVPAVVDAAPADAWTRGQLRETRAGTLTIVYQSIVDEYLDGPTRASYHAALEEAGRRATPDAPLAWARLEPISTLREHGVTLVLWPGGKERILATCGAHGTDVRRAP
jgi:hypothetical protein